MPTRLRSRVSAVEEKVARSVRKNAIRLYFVEGYPTDGAEDLLRANGRDLSVPHAIVAFIPAADAAPVASPLIDLTDRFQRGWELNTLTTDGVALTSAGRGYQ